MGLTHYLNNQPTLVVTINYTDLPGDMLDNVCKIEKPKIPGSIAKEITPKDGKTWLKTSVKAALRGNVWQVVSEYKLGKWVPEVYNPR